MMTVQQIFGMDQSVISEENLELSFGSLLEGVCLGYSYECRPAVTVAFQAFVDEGVVAVGGVFVVITAGEFIVVAPADPVLNRIDRIVVRRDNTTDTVWIGMKTGTPAANPVPPSLTRAGGIYEVSLAQLRVPAGVLMLLARYITDERGSLAVCGYITFRAAEHVRRATVEGMRQRGSWSARARATALTALDLSLLYAGLQNVDNARAAVQDADGVALQQDTTAGANNDAYVWPDIVTSPGARHRRYFSPIFECKFKLAQAGPATAQRVFVGLHAIGAIALVQGADALVFPHAALQYSTTRGDVNFQFTTITFGGAQNLIDSGVPADTAAHIIRIIMDSASVTFELMDTNRNIQARVRTTTSLPGVADSLWPCSAIRTLAAVVKTIYQYYGEGINRGI